MVRFLRYSRRLFLLLSSCRPVPDIAAHQPSGGEGEGGAMAPGPVKTLPVRLTTEVSRTGWLALSDSTLSPLALVEGRVTPRQARDLVEGAPADSLKARTVRTEVVVHEEKTWLVPLEPLRPSARYAVVSDAAVVWEVVTADEDVATLAWPVSQKPLMSATAVWCFQGLIPVPLGVIEHTAPGSNEPLGWMPIDEHCVAAPRLAPGSWVLPEQGDHKTPWSVSSRSWLTDDAAPPAPPVPINALDDRVWLGLGQDDYFVQCRWPEGSVARRSEGRDVLLYPFAPNASVHLACTVGDAEGRVATIDETLEMAQPMAHMVISEVFANPLGEDDGVEWLELYNDGMADADLAAFTLLDSSDTLALQGMLGAGHFAIVSASLDDAGEGFGAALHVSVPELSLSNSGEGLALVQEGNTVSLFPAKPVPKPGESLMRTSAKHHVDDPEGFLRGQPTPGRW